MTEKITYHLNGLGVLITRPIDQTHALAESIEKAHGRPLRFPTIEILPPPNKALAKDALANLKKTDLLIFISANAVRYAFPLMPDEIPVKLSIAAIGQATAEALREIGLAPDLMPTDDFSSQGLLALPELQQVQNQNISIVRGHGGREILKKTLEARGAQIEYIEVYHRQCPDRNPAHLIDHWNDWVDVVTINSGEALQNLCQLLGEAGTLLLKDTPLVVVSERLVDRAKQLGCEKVYLAPSALDKDVLYTLAQFAST